MLFLKEQIDLQDTELHIYNYICANLNSVIYMRIRELSLATNVSTSTILRFCKKFGCEGYSEFKYRLQEYANKSYVNMMEVYDETSNIYFLKRMQNQEYQSLIKEASSLILNTDLLLIVGLGASGVMAKYGQHLFSSLVTMAVAIEDPLNHPLYHLSKNLRGRICMIALSVSGEQDDIVEYIDNLKLYDSKIISITNKGNSMIAKLSDVNIPYYTDQEKYHTMDITSQLPVLTLLETMARNIHIMKYPQHEKIKEV